MEGIITKIGGLHEAMLRFIAARIARGSLTVNLNSRPFKDSRDTMTFVGEIRLVSNIC